MNDWQEHEIRDEYEGTTATQLNEEMERLDTLQSAGVETDDNGVALGEVICLLDKMRVELLEVAR